MTKIKTTSLILLTHLCLSIQPALAQNRSTNSMNHDSTSIFPFANMGLFPNTIITTSTPYTSMNGSCGSSNGSNVSNSNQLTNLCATGNPSGLYTNGTTIAWSCSGNYGAPSVAQCSASMVPRSGFLTVDISDIPQCLGGARPTVRNIAMVPYTVNGTVATYTSGIYGYGSSGSNMPGSWEVRGNVIHMQAYRLLTYSVSGAPAGVTFPVLSVVAEDGCAPQ